MRTPLRHWTCVLLVSICRGRRAGWRPRARDRGAGCEGARAGRGSCESARASLADPHNTGGASACAGASRLPVAPWFRQQLRQLAGAGGQLRATHRGSAPAPQQRPTPAACRSASGHQLLISAVTACAAAAAAGGRVRGEQGGEAVSNCQHARRPPGTPPAATHPHMLPAAWWAAAGSGRSTGTSGALPARAPAWLVRRTRLRSSLCLAMGGASDAASSPPPNINLTTAAAPLPAGSEPSHTAYSGASFGARLLGLLGWQPGGGCAPANDARSIHQATQPGAWRRALGCPHPGG